MISASETSPCGSTRFLLGTHITSALQLPKLVCLQCHWGSEGILHLSWRGSSHSIFIRPLWTCHQGITPLDPHAGLSNRAWWVELGLNGVWSTSRLAVVMLGQKRAFFCFRVLDSLLWMSWCIAFTLEEPSRRAISPTEGGLALFLPGGYIRVLKKHCKVPAILPAYTLYSHPGWHPSDLVHTQYLISFWHKLYEGGITSVFKLKKLIPKETEIQHLRPAELGHKPGSLAPSCLPGPHCGLKRWRLEFIPWEGTGMFPWLSSPDSDRWALCRLDSLL